MCRPQCERTELQGWEQTDRVLGASRYYSDPSQEVARMPRRVTERLRGLDSHGVLWNTSERMCQDREVKQRRGKDKCCTS